MKGPEYVYSVVKAYREAIDKGFKEELREDLFLDMGRTKTSFFLDPEISPEIIDQDAQTGTGLFLGKIISFGDSSIIISYSKTIKTGDRIRIQPQNGFEGIASNIHKLIHSENTSELCIKDIEGLSIGDSIYLISRKEILSGLDKTTKTETASIPYKQYFQRTNAILRRYVSAPEVTHSARPTLWIKVDTIGWLAYLVASPCQKCLFTGTPEQMIQLLTDKELFPKWKSRLVPVLPPFIPESKIGIWQKVIKSFENEGVTK
jgi:hypothetical protein